MNGKQNLFQFYESTLRMKYVFPNEIEGCTKCSWTSALGEFDSNSWFCLNIFSHLFDENRQRSFRTLFVSIDHFIFKIQNIQGYVIPVDSQVLKLYHPKSVKELRH